MRPETADSAYSTLCILPLLFLHLEFDAGVEARIARNRDQGQLTDGMLLSISRWCFTSPRVYQKKPTRIRLFLMVHSPKHGVVNNNLTTNAYENARTPGTQPAYELLKKKLY